MSAHAWIAASLLGGAVALCFASSLAVLVMRDAYQRLHYGTSVVSVAAALVLIALFLEDHGATVRLKAVLTVLILFFMNGVLSHATARAVRIRQLAEEGRSRAGADKPRRR